MRLIAMLVVLGGCEVTVPYVGGSSVTSAEVNVVPVHQAVHEVAARRCARQLSCERIGAGKMWPTFDACSRDLQAVTHEYLFGTCTAGIHATRLATCLADVDQQPCEQTAMPVASCRDEPLCH